MSCLHRMSISQAGVLAALAFLTIYSFSVGTDDTLSSIQSHAKDTLHYAHRKLSSNSEQETHLDSYNDPNPDKKRITLIALWNDDYRATYLPTLFSSAAAQKDSVDLLWINRKKQKDACLDVSEYVRGTTNIKTVCLTDWENKQLLAEYLCDLWDCSEEQRKGVDDHLRQRWDGINVDFKVCYYSLPLRESAS